MTSEQLEHIDQLEPLLSRDPEIECPRSERLFDVKNSFEVGQGAEETCPSCGLVLVCTGEDLDRWWNWEVKEGGQ